MFELTEVNRVPSSVSSSPEEPAPTPRSAAPTVMVIENDWIVGRALEKALELAGHEVLGVTSATRALEVLDGRSLDMALIALSAESPGVSTDLARRLHRATGAAIVYLADAWNRALADLTDPDPAGFLVKPFVEDQVAAVVAVATRRRRPRASAATPAESSAHSIQSSIGDDRETNRTRALQEAAAALVAAPDGVGTPRPLLTARQLEVLRLLLANGRVRTIAEDLQVSPHTVRNHLKSIYDKLGVHSQVDLIRKLTASVDTGIN